MADKILVVGGAAGIGAQIVEEYGDRALTWSRRTGVDATDEEQVQRATSQFLDAHGAPWAVVHAVGDFEERSLLDCDTALYRHLLESNLTSAFYVTRSLVPALVREGRGRVLLFAAAGVESQRAMRRAPVYFAVKAALVQMARALAAEVAASGVTVNVISPGIICHPDSHRDSQRRMAPGVPMGRAGTVQDVMGMVRWLLSDDAAYVTGANLTVDGGLSL